MILFVTIFVASLLAGVSILFHYECLYFLDRKLDSHDSHRYRLLITMYGLLLAHIAEIWFYAGAYMLLSDLTVFGFISTELASSHSFLDLVYYSAMVYTTVGFGDITPGGGLRLITATEALVGLSLITWSASFTFFQMQKALGKPRD